MDLTPLDRLKQRLVARDDYAAVAYDFLAGICSDDRFLKLGELTRSPLLTGVIRAAGRRYFDTHADIPVPPLIRVPEANLVHGAFLIGSRVASVFYFADVGIGVLSVVTADRDLPCTQFVRFAAATAAVDPSRN